MSKPFKPLSGWILAALVFHGFTMAIQLNLAVTRSPWWLLAFAAAMTCAVVNCRTILRAVNETPPRSTNPLVREMTDRVVASVPASLPEQFARPGYQPPSYRENQ